MNEKLSKAIENLQKVIEDEGIDPTKGLPQDLFLFATTLIPCPNIDLFISKGLRQYRTEIVCNRTQCVIK